VIAVLDNRQVDKITLQIGFRMHLA
jgi:hypothetical protein